MKKVTIISISLTVLFIAFAIWHVQEGRSEPQSETPEIFNMRFDGLTIKSNVYVPSTELSKGYIILIDFKSKVAIARVFFQTRWANGKINKVMERQFEVVSKNESGGTLKIPSRILNNLMSRETDWWVEDANGKVSNKLIQPVVIQSNTN